MEDENDASGKNLSNKTKGFFFFLNLINLDEFIKKLCHFCERGKCSYFCQGHCKRAFHEICKAKVEEGAIAGLDENIINYEVPEMKLDDEKLKKTMNIDYICKDCHHNVAICFKCKHKGSFYPEGSIFALNQLKS